VEEEGTVDCRPITRANEFLRQRAVFRDFGLGPDFQASPRSMIDEKEKNSAAGNMLAATPEASERESPIVQHTEETLWSAVILSKWPAVLADTRKMEGIAPTDERSFLGADLRSCRSRPAGSTRFRRGRAFALRWRCGTEKSYLSDVCCSIHVTFPFLICYFFLPGSESDISEKINFSEPVSVFSLSSASSHQRGGTNARRAEFYLAGA
jgi:hypothetical protein